MNEISVRHHAGMQPKINLTLSCVKLSMAFPRKHMHIVGFINHLNNFTGDL